MHLCELNKDALLSDTCTFSLAVANNVPSEFIEMQLMVDLCAWTMLANFIALTS